MSAEGKKKRGVSGAMNAKTIPFRYGGRPSNVSTALGRSQSFAGSRFLNALRLGIMLQGYSMSNRAELYADEMIEKKKAPTVVELME